MGGGMGMDGRMGRQMGGGPLEMGGDERGGNSMGGGRQQGHDMDFRGRGSNSSFGMMGMPMSDGSTYKASHRDRPVGNPNAWSSSGPGESRHQGGGFRGGSS